jgi:hypothetical protein
MAPDPILEMISAFTVGCMDKDNFVQFKDYIISGGSLPESELGDLQNIVSMIPVILDLEQPDPVIKDSIAKKLIAMQDEIKTRIREERKKTTQVLDKSSTFSDVKTVAGKTFLKEPPVETKPTLQFMQPKQKTKLSHSKILNPEFEKEPVRGTTKIDSIIPEQTQRLFTSQNPPPASSPESQDKQPGSLAGWLAVILVILLFTILGYYTYTSFDELTDELNDLKRDVTALRSELTTSNNFISNYISLIEFFNNRDVTIVNLTSPDVNDKALARLLFAFDQKEGLIQFRNARLLQANQGYQVWVVSKNQSYSIGVYTPNMNEYMRLTSFPFLPKDQIEKIRVTIESNTGSPTASIQTYLEGTLTGRK